MPDIHDGIKDRADSEPSSRSSSAHGPDLSNKNKLINGDGDTRGTRAGRWALTWTIDGPHNSEGPMTASSDSRIYVGTHLTAVHGFSLVASASHRLHIMLAWCRSTRRSRVG